MIWDEVKIKIRPRFLSRGKLTDEEFIHELDACNVHYQKFLDLVIGFIIISDHENIFTDAREVFNDMIKEWGVDAKTLYNQAIDNMKFDDYRLHIVGNPRSGEQPSIRLKEITKDDNMAMINNRYSTNGAVVILNSDICRSILGEGKWHIIPSSIHEVLFLRIDDILEPKELQLVISRTNEKEVLSSQVLSNSLYLWNNGKITLEV